MENPMEIHEFKKKNNFIYRLRVRFISLLTSKILLHVLFITTFILINAEECNGVLCFQTQQKC